MRYRQKLLKYYGRNFKEELQKEDLYARENENNNQGYIFINSGINLYKLRRWWKIKLEFGNNGFVETGEVEIPEYFMKIVSLSLILQRENFINKQE